MGFLALSLQILPCASADAQSRFINDAVAVGVGVQYLPSAPSAIGVDLGLAFSYADIGVQLGKVQNRGPGLDDVSFFGSYAVVYFIRPSHERGDSMGAGPFYEKVGGYSVAGGILTASRRIYESRSAILTPELSVILGIGIENADNPFLTGVSLSLGLGIGSIKDALIVLDPSVSLTGQGGGIDFGLSAGFVLRIADVEALN